MKKKKELQISVKSIAEAYARWIAREQFSVLLNQYVSSLISTQQKMNLTGQDQLNDILIHIQESMEFFQLVPDPWMNQALYLLDIGSGGGFPAIPLALAQPRWHIIMVESIRKKASFLEWMKQSLQLALVQVFHGRAEDLSRHYRDLKFDLITAKGVGESPYLFSLSRPVLKSKGLLVLWKHNQEVTPYLEHSGFSLLQSRPTVTGKTVLSLQHNPGNAENHVC